MQIGSLNQIHTAVPGAKIPVTISNAKPNGNGNGNGHAAEAAKPGQKEAGQTAEQAVAGD